MPKKVVHKIFLVSWYLRYLFHIKGTTKELPAGKTISKVTRALKMF